MAALGGPSGNGIPVAITLPLLPPAAKISSIVAGSKPAVELARKPNRLHLGIHAEPKHSELATGRRSGGNCATVPISAGPRFYRLRQ